MILRNGRWVPTLQQRPDVTGRLPNRRSHGFWRIIAIGALVLCAALVGERYFSDYRLTAFEPRTVSSRADLGGDERRTIELFRTVAPSVVSIQTSASPNPFSQEGGGGSGSGFLWTGRGTS